MSSSTFSTTPAATPYLHNQPAKLKSEDEPSGGACATNPAAAATTTTTTSTLTSTPRTFSPPPSTTPATNNPAPYPIFKAPAFHLADDLPVPGSPKQHKQPQSPSKPSFFLKSPTSFSTHRNSILSVGSVPRQTLLKALASGRPSLDPATLTASLDNVMTSPFPRSANYSPLPNEEGNFTEYHDAMESISSVPNTAKLLPALQSPCFYHQRFDNAVNVDRVLEEITGDEYTSHSRLVQTALGVREVARQLQRRNCKMNVKNIMIVTKARDNQLVNLTRELAHWIMKTPRYGSKLGVNVYVDKKLKESKRFDAAGLLKEEPKFKDMLRYWTPDLCWTSPETFDLVLTLGGDGTVLFTSWLFQRVVPPILSFSLGSLGFLTNFQFESYKEHLNKVLAEGMRVNMRMRFTCTVYRDEGNGQMSEGDQFEVLNELVIDRGPSPLTVASSLPLLACSTAYSLSAGGSLVHPDIPAILLTPICPHTLSFRPMLLNDSMLLRVSVPKSSRATAWCAFDGKGRVELKQGDHVTIAASQYPFPTVLSAPNEWIDSVSRTLRWNTRAAQQKAWEGDSTSSDGPNLVEEWDIDTDSGVYDSGSDETGKSSPLRRQMSLLNFA
ncbi:ATP-NAD kinase-like domain-containing protein [Tuber brumale]|nr:ATP-NAD kinase-like domain-containing protein [Tuber brumale]